MGPLSIAMLVYTRVFVSTYTHILVNRYYSILYDSIPIIYPWHHHFPIRWYIVDGSWRYPPLSGRPNYCIILLVTHYIHCMQYISTIPLYHLIPSYTILYHLIPSYTILYHLIPSYTILYHFIPSYTILDPNYVLVQSPYLIGKPPFSERPLLGIAKLVFMYPLHRGNIQSNPIGLAIIGYNWLGYYIPQLSISYTYVPSNPIKFDVSRINFPMFHC
jgi:hypothetical protein